MIQAGRVALVAAAGLILAWSAQADSLRRASLTIFDHLSAGQQEETIAVYLGGVLVGTLHVDPAHLDDRIEASVPEVVTLHFALCGRLLRREADGHISAHPIDNGGTLTGYAGGTWAAITLSDVVFTLKEESGRGDSVVTVAPACSAAVS